MKKYLLLIAFLAFGYWGFGQTVTITPTTLDCGKIEIYNVTDGSHNFDAAIGAASPTQDITIDAYDPTASNMSPSFEVSIDGTNWSTSITFTPSTAGETKTIYVRNSPTVDQSDNKSSDIYVYNADYSSYDDIVASTTIIYPEMDVEGNSSAINDGSSTPSTTNNTDFGNVNINSNKDIVYTIENSKSGFPPTDRGKLFLKDNGSGYVELSGTDASMFSVTVTPSSPINPAGGTSDFTVRFTPTSSGTKTATITIYSNDQDENPYNYDIQGTGVAVAPTVSSTTAASSRTATSAQSGGNVTDDGGSAVTERGVCWNTSTAPTISNSHSSDGTGTGTFSSTISGGISSGSLYYVRAYATNSIGTDYGPEITFYTLSTEPSDQASSLTNPSKSESTLDLSWSSATGADGYLVLQKDGSTAPNSTGVEDGMVYTSFTSIPAGTSVITETTGTSYQVTGLSSSTQYSFAIIPFAKGSDNATYNYKTDGTLATITATTVTASPTTQASGIKYSGDLGSGQMEITWTSGNGDGQIVIMKANSSASNPSNGTSYTGNTTFGSGDDLGDGSFVVYRASSAKGGQIFVTNLSDGTDYYFKVLEYSGTGTQTSYNTDETSGWNSGNTANSALPIDLIDFYAESNTNNKVSLKWETASELNNDQFIIERSIDAVNFESIGKVQGSGTTNIPISYSFSDANNPASIVYYRLKQVDYDGTTTTHSMVSIDMSNNNEGTLLKKALVLNTNLSLELNLEETGATKISLLDINGKLIQGAMSTTPGAQTISFDMTGLSHGIYLIRIQQNDKIVSRKIAY